MDQVNPLSGLTIDVVSLRLAQGVYLVNVLVEVRDVHFSHYGRMCPIETPGDRILV